MAATSGNVATTALTPNLLLKKEHVDRGITGITDTLPSLFVSPHTYPLFAPYRDNRRMSGRTPRLLSIMISTLIHTGDPCWDPRTRQLSLDASWMKLSKRLGIYHSQTSTQAVQECFMQMGTQKLDSPDPMVAVAGCRFVTENRADYKTVTFRKQYVEAAVSDLREIPARTVARLRSGALSLDLMVLAAWYVPEKGRLVMPYSVLDQVLPSTSRFERAKLRDNLIEELNRVQAMWRFECDRRDVVVTDVVAQPDSPDFVSVTLR